MNNIYSIEQILPLTLRKIGITKKFTIQSLFVRWAEFVGSEIASHSAPSGCKQGILFVNTMNSVWCHHLTMMRTEIIDKINQFAGDKIISEIRFYAGYLKDSQNETDIEWQEPTLKEQLRKIKIDRNQTEKISEISSHISDTQLRRKVFRVLYKNMVLQEWKKQKNWHKCEQCDTLCSPENKYCTTCEIEQRRKTIHNVRKLLTEIPWIKYTECTQYIQCNPYEFFKAKRELIDFLVVKSKNKPKNSVQVVTLVMLLSGVKPQDITDEITENTLQYVRRKENVFTHRSG